MRVTTVPSPVDALFAAGRPTTPADGPAFPDTLREARTSFESDRSDESDNHAIEARGETNSDAAPDTNPDAAHDTTPDAEGRVDESAEVTASVPTEENASAWTAAVATVTPVDATIAPSEGIATSAENATVGLPQTSAEGRTPGVPGAPAAAERSGEAPAAPVPATRTPEKAQATSSATGTAESPQVTPTSRTGDAAPASPTSVEGETTIVEARGGAPRSNPATEPLAAREATAAGPTAATDDGWFARSQATSVTAGDRATFHLLGGTEDGAATPQASSPRADVAAVIAATLAASTDAVAEPSSNSSASPVAPVTARSEGSASALAAQLAEVVNADPEEPTVLARRVYRAVRRALGRGDSELHLRLDPPRLGRVDVDLSVDDERLGIRFTVDTEEVRESLRRNLDELHRSLEGTGWLADSVDIDLRQEGTDPKLSGDADRSRAGDGGSETEEEPDGSSEIRLRHLGRTVDLRG